MPTKINRTSTKRNNVVKLVTAACATLLIITMNYVQAGEADVLDASITHLGQDRFRIDATVKHADAGWEHYADRWDVLDAEGQVLGSRELAHPHDNEQPFTRSLTLTLPKGLSVVTIRANDSVHGLGGAEFTLAIPTI